MANTGIRNTMKLWHCKHSRSLRPLWALEEMGLNYELELLPFPPRIRQREFLEDNPLGTVPYFVDGEISMTESSAICHYLSQKYNQLKLSVAVDHSEYGDHLNWLYHSDATLTFPQTLCLRYSKMEPQERRQPQIVDDYRIWFHARLKRLDAHMIKRKFLNDDRFTIADIAIGYALYLGKLNGFSAQYSLQVSDYLDRLLERPAFKRANEIG